MVVWARTTIGLMTVVDVGDAPFGLTLAGGSDRSRI